MKTSKYLLLLIIPIIMISGLNCGDGADEHAGNNKQVYTCPMHPEIISDKPGVCPICHMDLVLKADDSAVDEEINEGLMITSGKQILANISTVKVRSENIYKTVKAFSYLDFAEQSKKIISARFNGRIEKLYIDKTGDYINKGEPLFEVYSPDLVQAQNEYLLSLNGLSSGAIISAGQGSANLANSAKQKLLLYGLTEKQISDIEKNRSVSYTATYYAPFSGTVIEKKVQEGMYVNEGSVIYEVADMSSLWNIAEVYESDLSIIKQGTPVQLTLNSYPGEIFNGKVILVYPVVNQESRTVKIRSAVANKGNKLKPNMYGETSFSANLGNGLVVPEEAVLLTGERNIVWVLVSKSGKQKTFEAREVSLGTKINGNYHITAGLSEGEEVAASGAYLIDSESQLRGGQPAAHQEHQGGSQGNNKSERQNKKTADHSSHNQSSSAGIWNKVCPVLGGKVNPKVATVDYNGKKIGFCCPGCDKDFNENPESYMKNLSSDGTRYIVEKEN